MHIDALESRSLMSVSVDVPAQTLTINGRDGIQGDDVITAKVEAGLLKVSDNGADFSITASSIKKIFIFAKAGADQITLAPSVTQRAVVFSGSGGAGGAGDEIQTGSGNDEIRLQSPFSTARGGSGNDYITNEVGASGLYGEAGNDQLLSRLVADGDSFYDGGPGYDAADYSAAKGGLVIRNGQTGTYAADTGNPPIVSGATDDTLVNFEGFYGGSGDDFIYGDNNSNLLRGNGGNDYLQGNGGADTIEGGAGTNTLVGNDGNDIFRSRNGAKDTVIGGSGFDQAQSDAIDVLNSIEAAIP